MKRIFIQEIPGCPDAEILLGAVARGKYPFFLDSALPGGRLGRYSFLGFGPVARFSLKRGALSSEGGGDLFGNCRTAMDAVRAVQKRFASADFRSEETPFPCGLAGFLSYDLRHEFEILPRMAADDLGFPDAHFGLYDFVIAIDHDKKRTSAVAANLTGGDSRAFRDGAKRRLDAILKAAEKFARRPDGNEPSPPPRRNKNLSEEPECNFMKESYIEAVIRAKEYIAAGDIYQVNLSQRFSLDVRSNPLEIYLDLRRTNPAPFAAYLDLREEGAVLSSSPERFLKISGRRVETRPIKGTRPRKAGDEEFNSRMREELLKSAKDAAELAMIVDLERNDLGRVAQYGTVRVSEPKVLEEYPTVYHLVATVEAELRSGMGAPEAISAGFPGGSITGAPKIRAMEIIDELEPTARSVYTGCIGYIGLDGNMDSNIAIRTVLLKDTRAYWQVGGGIVADSDPEAEYVETLDKGIAMRRVLEKFS
jgi:para-aminobenzoate synthetase component 1